MPPWARIDAFEADNPVDGGFIMSQNAQPNQHTGGPSLPALPLFLNLAQKHCVVVGGGAAAVTKVRQLFDVGALVTVIVEAAEPPLFDRAISDAITLLRRAPMKADFEDAALVFIAVEDGERQSALAALARDAGALVNVVDAPAACDFIMPAHVDRGPLTIAIGTQGLAPSLAVKMRQELDAMLPERLGELVDFAGRYRATVKSTNEKPGARRRFWQDFFDGPVADAVLAGDRTLPSEAMLKAINSSEKTMRQGRVTLILLPGFDSDLLPVGALRRLYQADHVAYQGDAPSTLLKKNRRDVDVSILLHGSEDRLDALHDLAVQGARVVIVSDDSEFLADVAIYLNTDDRSYRVERFENGLFIPPAEAPATGFGPQEVGSIL
jgi:siroheme synthase-like protein